MVAPIVVVAGARPNFMKVAPVLRALARQAPTVPRVLVHTGQHYDAGMSEVFFQELGIPPPDVHLGVGSGAHGAQTARVLEGFERYLLDASPRPRGVVVVGDVNSTMACALASVKLGVPVAHVEAGLRSGDRAMPEEINRVVTDAVCDLLLTSEPSGGENLRREGVPEGRVRFVGNVMIDTLVHELRGARALSMKARLGLSSGRHALITLHRPSNVDDPERLGALVTLLGAMAERMTLVFPAHPRTRAALAKAGLLEELVGRPGVLLREPLSYRENLGVMESAAVVLTDSGGIQEESTFLGVPCLTLRANTERPVTVSHGTNTLVGDDLSQVPSLVEMVLAGRYKRAQGIDGWDGRAAERVAEVLLTTWAVR